MAVTNPQCETERADLVAAVEAETQTIGRSIWEHLERRTPSMFERRWWDERVLSWAMSDESVKVQMFRFVDVLPMLKTHEQVTRHLQEYFEEVRQQLPWAARIAMDISQPNSVLGKALALNARSNARRMAERFIAGTRVEEVLQGVAKIRKQGLAFTLDLLGEAVMSEKEAEAYQQSYLELIQGLAREVNAWPESPQIDCDQHGPIPRVNVSLKLSSLYSQFKPIDPQRTAAEAKTRLRPILRCARENDAYVHVDMEQYAYKDLTLAIYQQVLMEDEFRDLADTGIVIQAYFPEAERDLQDLLEWVQERGTPIWVRLVKGAYWDYETVLAEYNNWPVPVFQQKWQSDENFERLTRFLMEHSQWLRPAMGSHNVRSLAHGIAWARTLDVPQSAYEIQMLYGMGGEQAQLLAEMGHRVRIYTPFGELIPGMAYLVRRLLENTSNDSFLRQSFTEHVSVEDLLMRPAEVGAKMSQESRDVHPPSASRDVHPPSASREVHPPSASRGVHPPGPDGGPEARRSLEPMPEFSNEPHADFSKAENRKAMQQALDEVAGQLGREYPLVINGRAVETKSTIASRNPSHKTQVVGRTASAGPEEAAEAIAAARRAVPQWRRTEPKYRAEYLELVAAEMHTRRFELAAWEVFECAKPWAEADADVTEAIDFCRYYAQQMRRLAVPRQCDVAGEENTYSYRPRGVAVVIAPWNFPLAILTGMTAASLVTGNTVVMKPAEQSPVIAAKLMEIFQNVGIPDGVVNYLPGVGEEVGPELVGSPDIDLMAFTGSRAVGLEINRRAADTDSRQKSVKRVIAEMGGKNAIIVDDDADLDEAVAGVVASAFGYAGQKCSACSRAIVLASAYDTFLQRLIEATRSLRVGPAEDPGTSVPAVIDEEAYQRVQEYIEIGKEEATLALECDLGECGQLAPRVDRPLAERADHIDLAGEGYYIGPHIFTDVDPQARIAQEEIFGPVLAVIRAKDLDEAFRIANGVDYGLTGGIFSRSPGNLNRAKREFDVGNLYLNRGITGSLVERQPFGGFKMSGIGTKAGGPDYLHEFLIPVNVTENTMRRGFAPPPDEEK